MNNLTNKRRAPRAGKAVAILTAALMVFAMSPIGHTAKAEAATTVVKKPITLTAGKDSSGTGWNWDGTTNTLTLSDFQMDLSSYSKSYTAGITLPKVTGGVTLVTEGTNSVTMKGKKRNAILSKGEMSIVGSEGGTLGVTATGGSTGIYAKGPLQISNGADITVNSTNEGISTEKTLEITESTLDVTIDGNNIFSGAIIAANNDKEEIGLATDNADITTSVGGREGFGLVLYERNMDLIKTTYTQTLSTKAIEVNGIGALNGILYADECVFDINIGKAKEEGTGSLLYAGAEDPDDPAENPTIAISNSNITGYSNGYGLYSPYWGYVQLYNTHVEIDAFFSAIYVGSGGLNLEEITGVMTGTNGYITSTVWSNGPVHFINCDLVIREEGEDSNALAVTGVNEEQFQDGHIFFEGANTNIIMRGTSEAVYLVSDDITDEDIGINILYDDNIFPVEGGTLQRVLDVNPYDGSKCYNWSFSEGTLDIDDDENLINASSEVTFAPKTGIVITRQPQNTKVCYPDAAEFTVETTDPGVSKTYEWWMVDTEGNETKLDTVSASTPHLVINPTSLEDNNNCYYCKISTDTEELVSKSATLNVATSIRDKEVMLSENTFTYNGKVQRPEIVTIGGDELVEGKDFVVKLPKPEPKDAGIYTMTIEGIAAYGDSVDATYEIVKAANPMTAKGKTVKIKYSKLKKKSVTVKRSSAISITKSKGKLTYTKVKGNSKITVNETTGKITVKKGLKKKLYKVSIEVTDDGGTNYEPKSKTVTVKIRVK